eukprot:30601-Prorocentrum_minimum.AAC.1
MPRARDIDAQAHGSTLCSTSVTVGLRKKTIAKLTNFSKLPRGCVTSNTETSTPTGILVQSEVKKGVDGPITPRQ